jgi:hypothetical protein
MPLYQTSADLPRDAKAWKRDNKIFLDQRKSHMSLVRRCRFVLQDGKKFTELSDKLRRYLGSLLSYCTWEFMQVLKASFRKSRASTDPSLDLLERINARTGVETQAQRE